MTPTALHHFQAIQPSSVTSRIMVSPGDDPLAAALAAAAELARNGSGFLFAAAGGIPHLTSNCSPVEQGSKAVTMTAESGGGGVEYSSNFPVRIPPSSPCLRGTSSEDDEDDDDDCDSLHGHNNVEENSERRIARSRERNREHARRTRIRKKAQMEALQSKVRGLQAESKVLKQSLEECSIASILVGLSSGEHDETIQSLVKEATEIEGKDVFKIVAGKRKRFVSDAATSERVSQPLKVNINGQTTFIGGSKTHINWKSGVYSDENGIQKQLTNEQLESLRRERNRMHAKMTRDRKKSFISTVEQTIHDLESTNQRMKAVLTEVVQTHFKSNKGLPGVTPSTSPALAPKIPLLQVPSFGHGFTQIEDSPKIDPANKRVRHGFSLVL